MPGFIDRHFGALLTVFGVVVTALLAAFSNLFGASGNNEVPTSKIVFADRYRAAGGAPDVAHVPVGSTMRVFADDSSDPDSELASLTHTWIVTPGDVRGKCAANLSECRYHDFKPTKPGDYIVSLVVSDAEDFKRNCALIHRWNNRLGCRKHSIATVQVEVSAAAEPEIILTEDVESVARGESIRLDATLSQTFDGAAPQITWTVDGKLFARSRPVVTIPTTTLTEAQREVTVTAVARDRLNFESTRELVVLIEDPEAVPLPPRVVTGGPLARPVEPVIEGITEGHIRVCRGGGPVALTASVTAGPRDVDCTLPSEIITNGHELTIRAKKIIGNNAVIRAFSDIPARAADGARGENGENARGLGQDGEDGGAGLPGNDGVPGKNASAVALLAKTFEGTLRIENEGQPGGAAGNGGPGGNGGAGAPGFPAITSFLNCSSGPGRGGSGGAGGAGGRGGKGGQGGAGGPLTVEIEEFVPGSTLTVSTAAGVGGTFGQAGVPGRGGRAGPEGATQGFCGSAGRSGLAGRTGRPGQSGERPVPQPPALVVINGEILDASAQAKGPLQVVVD